MKISALNIALIFIICIFRCNSIFSTLWVRWSPTHPVQQKVSHQRLGVQQSWKRRQLGLEGRERCSLTWFLDHMLGHAAWVLRERRTNALRYTVFPFHFVEFILGVGNFLATNLWSSPSFPELYSYSPSSVVSVSPIHAVSHQRLLKNEPKVYKLRKYVRYVLIRWRCSCDRELLLVFKPDKPGHGSL